MTKAKKRCLCLLYLAVLLEAWLHSHLFLGPNATFSAFYPVYDQPFATDRVLRQFRSVYPDSQVYLFNDGGIRILKKVAEKYNARYFYRPRHTSYFPVGTHWNSSLMSRRYVEDLIFTAKDSNSDWVIMLEDDVELISNFDASELAYDVNGKNPDPISLFPQHTDWERIQKFANMRGHAHYSASGGCAIRGSFLRSLNISKVHSDLDLLFQASKTTNSSQILPSDLVLSFLVQANLGTLGTYQHYAYHWWPTNYILVPIGFVHVKHGDKSNYKK